MKSILLSFLCLALSISTFAQQTAPDFTVTDLDGVEHNLYNYLNDGKVVIVDVSATWCSICWSFHQGHFLEDIYQKYGPNGTDQVVVLFYEGDANTGDNAVFGTGGSTKGDWTNGSSYPFINESPLSLDMSVWNKGFPTVSVVNPADKTIVADLTDYKNQGVEAMYEVIDNLLGPVAVKDEQKDLPVRVYPNPFTESVTIDLSESINTVSSIEIVNSVGKSIENKIVNSELINISTENYIAGNYFVLLKEGNKVVGRKSIIKN